jgi:hypothetical protein
MAEQSISSNTITPTNEREEAALAYAESGVRVLPLLPRDKAPAVRDWPNSATTDAAQIGLWWAENPDCNVGILTGHGLVVLDADSEEALAALSDLPPTRTVNTSSGKHFYFHSDRTFKNNAKKLRKTVDVRSLGGYVVAPPSIHPDGTRYEWEDESVPIAFLPAEMEQELLESQNPATELPEKADLLFLEGQRNEGLTKLAGDLVRRGTQAGLSLDEIKAVLRLRNEQTCLPPLPDTEVNTIAASVYRAEQRKRPDRNKIQLLSLADIERQPDPEFLIDGWLVKSSLAILYGEPKVGKTFIALDMAIRVASGGSWFGSPVSPTSVVYVCAEGLRGMKPRIAANRYRNNVTAEPNLTFVGRAIQLHQPTEIDAFISSLHEAKLQPGLVVFDTLSRCSVGVDENTAKDMNQVIAGLERVKREFDATVLILHHSKKADAKIIRGSGVLLGAVDTSLSLTAGSQPERVLSVKEQKESESGKTLTFALENVNKSAVPVLVGKTSSAPGLSEKEEKALSTLSMLGAAEHTTWLRASGLARSTFNRCRTQLEKLGLIQTGEDGRYGLSAEPS